MTGQLNLISKIKAYDINSFPHTLLLIGDRGCGKHHLVNEIISKHLNLDVIDITENISFDYILDIQLKSIPYIYLINTSLLTEKQQNIILKFIEEPLSNSYIILLSEDKNSLLDTIINRCIIYQFEPYTEEELSSFISFTDEHIKSLSLKIATTPGQLISTDEDKMKRLQTLCTKIITKMKDASYPNSLKVVNELNYKEDSTKLDINMFFNALLIGLHGDYVNNKNELSLKLFYKTAEYKNKLLTPKINKEVFMENFITSIWKLTRI
jgi:DNA polymerase III delta prime subunit